jgi:hypothetical protein
MSDKQEPEQEVKKETKEVNNFDVLKEMALRNMDIRGTYAFDSMKKRGKKHKLTMHVGEKMCMDLLDNPDKYIFITYMVDADQYDAMAEELKK